MSRGSKVVYIDSAAELPLEDIQNGDVAIEKSNGGVVSSDTATHKAANKIWQYQNDAWSEILTRAHVDPSDVSEKRTNWTDEIVTPNVTKIRRAHIEDVREYLNFIQKMYSKRYGDTYFNTHDYSNAILKWSRGSDAAKIYFAQYTDENKQYLTFEFGGNFSGDPESTDNDRVKFIFRGFDTPSSVSSIFDITAKSLLSYVPVYIYEDLSVTGTTKLWQTLEVVGMSTFYDEVYLSKSIHINGFAYLKMGESGGLSFVSELVPNSWGVIRKIESEVDGSTELQIASQRTGEGVDTVGIYANDNNGLYVNGHPVMHGGNMGHGSGFDSDTVDGYHASSFILNTNAGTTFLEYATPGTYYYTVPEGLTGFKCSIVAIAGGGGGGGGAGSTAPNSDPTAGGGGGGSGGKIYSEITLTAGENLTIVVGNAGAGGAPQSGGAYVYATSGGSGEATAVSSDLGAWISVAGGAGGSGGGIIGGNPVAGTGGAPGGTNGSTNSHTTAKAGIGGSNSPYGYGGEQTTITETGHASGYGAGGGGGLGDGNSGGSGGNGSGGYVRIEMFVADEVVRKSNYIELINWLDQNVGIVPFAAR